MSVIRSSNITRSNTIARWLTAAKKASILLALMVAALISVYPIVMMMINSFKSDREMYINPAGLPIDWTLESYGKVFQYHGGLWLNIVNSIIISLISTIIAVFLSALAAYAFAKYQFRGRDTIFALLLATFMIPPEIIIPGQYIFFARLHLINTLHVQILPTITPILGLFFIRQYMALIPNDLLEAARVDGAGHFTVFTKIMVPVCTPVLGAYAILHFMSVWNAYTWPVLVAIKREVQPAMVVLPQMVDPVVGFLPVWGTIMAGATLATLPILIVFLSMQGKFMSSVTVGSVKG
jgi:ABC-type glycerol-3-phosphate transport system permease component